MDEDRKLLPQPPRDEVAGRKGQRHHTLLLQRHAVLLFRRKERDGHIYTEHASFGRISHRRERQKNRRDPRWR